MHLSLSRIDLCLCTPLTARLLWDIQYLVRGVSDHSPLVISVLARPTTDLPRAPWKLNAFWLNLFPAPERISEEI